MSVIQVALKYYSPKYDFIYCLENVDWRSQTSNFVVDNISLYQLNYTHINMKIDS